MKLISNLDVNGNSLRDGDKNIGPVEKQIIPVNKEEITIQTIQDAILVNGEVPEGFTFEEFIDKLMVKVNGEISTTDEINPTVTVSGALSGTATDNMTLEVGAAAGSYTVTNTATKGSYTDGQALTHTKTMGRSEESEEHKNIGCTEGEVTWNGDEGKNTITKTITMTVFAPGNQGTEETKSVSIGNITLTQAYGASTKDVTKEGDEYIFQSSYGNPLYSAAGEAIPAGSCTATTTTGRTITITTKFYSWVKGVAKLGNVSLTNQNDLVSGNVIIFPADKNISIKWTTVQTDDSAITDQMYTAETKYIALPSGGTATLLDVAPSDSPYKTYTVWTINDNIPEFTSKSNVKITIS